MHPLKALVIEDNPVDAVLIKGLLAKSTSPTYDVEVVPQLPAGLERLARGRTDVILLDLTLPDSEGLETFIRVHESAAAIPIVVLTGLDDLHLAAKAVECGASALPQARHAKQPRPTR